MRGPATQHFLRSILLIMMIEIEVLLIAKNDLANNLGFRNIDSHTCPQEVISSSLKGVKTVEIFSIKFSERRQEFISAALAK